MDNARERLKNSSNEEDRMVSFELTFTKARMKTFSLLFNHEKLRERYKQQVAVMEHEMVERVKVLQRQEERLREKDNKKKLVLGASCADLSNITDLHNVVESYKPNEMETRDQSGDKAAVFSNGQRASNGTKPLKTVSVGQRITYNEGKTMHNINSVSKCSRGRMSDRRVTMPNIKVTANDGGAPKTRSQFAGLHVPVELPKLKTDKRHSVSTNVIEEVASPNDPWGAGSKKSEKQMGQSHKTKLVLRHDGVESLTPELERKLIEFSNSLDHKSHREMGQHENHKQKLMEASGSSISDEDKKMTNKSKEKVENNSLAAIRKIKEAKSQYSSDKELNDLYNAWQKYIGNPGNVSQEGLQELVGKASRIKAHHKQSRTQFLAPLLKTMEATGKFKQALRQKDKEM